MENVPPPSPDFPPVDLEGLTLEQQEIAKRMLHEEAESFSKDDDDIDCIEDLKLKLNLSDQRPPPSPENIQSYPEATVS